MRMHTPAVRVCECGRLALRGPGSAAADTARWVLMDVIVPPMVLMWMLMGVAVMRVGVLLVRVAVMRVPMVRMSMIGVVVVCVAVVVVVAVSMRMAVGGFVVVVRLRRAPALCQQEDSHP